MEKKINAVSEFVNGLGVISFDASVISITHEGKKDEKKPIVATLKLETTGENFTISTWNFDLLEPLKKMVSNLSFANFEGTTSEYKGQVQIRVGKIKETYLAESSKKKESQTQQQTNIDSVKAEFCEFVKTYIVDETCLFLINKCILENVDFFRWPAAKRVHHNFPGGLAKHSLSVAKLVLAYGQVYGYDRIDMQIALTGALLHDIGKMNEYTAEGEITLSGNFMTHLVSGVLVIDRAARALQQQSDREKQVLMSIKHIIQAHHEKLEFGSPVQPKTVEAYLVSQADLSDSRFETIFNTVSNQLPGTFSENILALDGGKIYKWKM